MKPKDDDGLKAELRQHGIEVIDLIRTPARLIVTARSYGKALVAIVYRGETECALAFDRVMLKAGLVPTLAPEEADRE